MKKLAALGFLAALCTSCLPVPFDLAVSQAAATAQKMTRDNSSLITSSYYQDGSQRDFAFYPQVLATGGFDYGAGFVTALGNLSVDIQAVANSSTYSGTSQPIPNPDPKVPAYLAWPVKSGTSYLFGVVFDALSPTMGSGYALFQATPPSTFMTVGTGSLQGLAGGTTRIVIGASMAADSSLGFDMLHLLAWDPSTLYFFEVGVPVQASGFGGGTQPRAGGPLSFIPVGSAGINRCMYFYDENRAADPGRLDNRSFASWYDTSSGSWVSYAWWESPTGSGNFSNMRLPVDHRLDALLSTGQLLSTEGGMGRLYDRDGNLRATFPLGNLVYIAEEYVGGVPRCYFSQCLVYDNRLHFNVYWIQTDQLGTLGN